jgi:hypothetical protein
VAVHGHTPGQNLNNNVISGNLIMGNAADSDDSATPGPTGINFFSVSPVAGTVISQNIIRDETNDIVINAPGFMNVHLNDLFGHEVGLNNLGAATVDATENWWGCAAGPTSSGCSSVSGNHVNFTPWLFSPFVTGKTP